MKLTPLGAQQPRVYVSTQERGVVVPCSLAVLLIRGGCTIPQQKQFHFEPSKPGVRFYQGKRCGGQMFIDSVIESRRETDQYWGSRLSRWPPHFHGGAFARSVVRNVGQCPA